MSKNKKESSEVATVTDEKQLAIPFEEFSAGTEEAEASDIIIPRMLLMQGTSKWVTDSKFNLGDIMNSVEEVKIGDKNKPVEVLPFLLRKTWEIFEDVQNGPWLGSEAWNSGNDDLDWQFEREDEEKGLMKLKRQRNYGFYVFNVADLGSGFPVPMLLNFRSSSGFKEGKKIASHFSMMKGLQQPGHNVVWSVKSEGVSTGEGKDKRAYQKFVVQKARNATPEEMASCQQWLKLLSSNRDRIKDHNVDEADDSESTTTSHTKSDVAGKEAQF